MTKELPSAAAPNHLPWLDGVRGFAALWVLVHHAFVLTGGRGGVPVLSWGKLAVDLFMLVSGFLMAHHYLLRRQTRPWSTPSTWTDFWARRWFRLSPLYYVLLAVALVLGTWLGEQRGFIAMAWPATATPVERYSDHSLTNILLHVTYAFGAIPQYAFRTVLPDWSIGLEAQFYLAFPFIMLFLARFGPLRAGIALVIACIGLRAAFPEFFRSFQMPAFLPMKLYIFLLGIWLAVSQWHKRVWPYVLTSLLVAAGYAWFERSLESAARVVLVLAAYSMVHGRGYIHGQVGRLLSGRIAQRMGDTSYGLYLVHLLIMIPVVAALAGRPDFVQMHWAIRCFLVMLVVIPIAYGCAWGLFRFVETPGIAAGKKALSRHRNSPHGVA
jgi:peptidoglycan/LPS O-acetylase OafA/YrhL